MRKSSESLPDFGVVQKLESEIPFQLVILSEKEKITIGLLKNISVALVAGDSFENFHVAKLCQKNMAKCVYTIEYIPETRYQINSLQTKNIVIRLRRDFYLWAGEKKRLAAFSAADGIQANGTAAYDGYKQFKNCLLYFDTRVYSDTIINEQELNLRLSGLTQSRPLRLAFSGRLIKMKGADHLIQLASLLKVLGMPFQMAIYGAGQLEDDMANQIRDMGLSDEVTMKGAVDFYNELLPDLKSKVDLFVVLHRQSDPSCTYLETLSCGIPIVGYNNKAFSGLLQRADVGWGVSMDDVHEVVNIINYINNNREILREKSINSLNFSRFHDFESTFKNRIDHLSQLIE